jgi:hypothetical protein
MEHRLGRRVAVDIPVRLNLSFFGAQHGRLINLSLSGGFITTPLELRVLSRLQVFIEMPGLERDEQDSIAAYVARKADHGIGVEWCEFAPVSVAALLRMADSHPLQRDRVLDLSSVAAIPATPARRLKRVS